MGNPDEKSKPITEVMDLNPYATQSSQPKELVDKPFAELISDDYQSGKVKPGESNNITTTNDSEGIDVNALVDGIYKDPIKSLSEKLKGIDEELRAAKEQDETYKRRARSMKMIAGISDGLAAMANMIGVAGVNGAHASNQQLVGASPALAERFEEARLERKEDIKTISDRLEQYKAQEDALRLQRGQTLASFTMRKAEMDANAAMQQAENDLEWMMFQMGQANENARFQTQLAADLQMHEEEMEATKKNRPRVTYTAPSRDSDINIRIDGRQVTIPDPDPSTVAAIFALLPADVQNRYGKPMSGVAGIAGRRYDPTEEEMRLAIGANSSNPEFQSAFRVYYGMGGGGGGSLLDDVRGGN